MGAAAVIFRSRQIFPPKAAALVVVAIGAVFAAVLLLHGGVWRWAVGGLVFTVLAAFAALSWRYRLVMELALEAETLLVRTMVPASGFVRIAIAQTTGWRDYVETRRGFGLTTISNRILAFRHDGVAYGMALDHAELLDLDGLDQLRTRVLDQTLPD